MIRKLLVVFASGLVLAIFSLGGAWAIGGDELVQRVRTEGWDHDWDEDEGREGRAPYTRPLAFDPARPLTVNLPVSLRFQRGDKTEMTVSGPRRVVERLRWEDGRLSLDGSFHSFRTIKVTITAPRLAALTLHGPSHVDLDGLDQPDFALATHGPSDLRASGKVARLSIEANGPADIDMEDVAAGDARVRVHGVGNVDISASGAVDAELSGVGNVTLHRKPASLTSRTRGVGGIREDYNDGN